MHIGIDLGTSNSAIAGIGGGKARIFRPADGGEALPSVIYFDKRGHRLYGRRAYDQSLIAPDNVASGFKRLLGTATPIEVKGADVSLSPEECSADIIRQLLGQAQTETGIDVFDGAVIAIPASFNQMQSEATLRAAKLAGLKNVDLIQEPIAAALASMAGAKRSGNFMIYDLGGGTFDLALVEARDGKVRILAQQGVNMLGGRDFDRLIVTEILRPWLNANFDLPDKFLRDPLYRRLNRIALMAAERAKIDLSTLEEASIFASDDEVRLMDQSETEIFLDAPVTRAGFEELIREPVEQTVSLMRSLLEDNALEPADVDRIVFVGGPTRIPLVRRLVTESFGIAADLRADPMTVVAEGAALYAEGREWMAEAQTEAQTGAQTTETKPATAPESAPKVTDGHSRMADEPDLYFDFDLRTPDEKTLVRVRVEGESKGRKIRLSSPSWKSEEKPLSPSLSFEVPLSEIGGNVFDVRVSGEGGQDIDSHSQKLTIVRLVAAPSVIPAAHSIGVKVRKTAGAEENSFVLLVKKGDPLPAFGEISLKSGTELTSGSPGSLGFEVFQIEVLECVDVNLCVGLFRIDGADLPQGCAIRTGEPIVFSWRMNESGILNASVRLPASGLSLDSPRFYAPQAGQISYQGESGDAFTRAVLERAREEWGDLAAAVGPSGGADISILKTRLSEQADLLQEAAGDGELLRRISEEARFIRQDVLRLGQKYAPALLQRKLGKLEAAFNRVCRGRARQDEIEAFDEQAAKAQTIIDDGDPASLEDGRYCVAKMRRLFFDAAWRDGAYVRAWFRKLSNEAWLFADAAVFSALIDEGNGVLDDPDALRNVVVRLLDARIALSASDAVNDLATIVKE